MAIVSPLVLAADGLIEQIQVGDVLAGNDGIQQLLIQNNALIRLIASVFMTLSEAERGDLPVLNDEDIEALIAEITP